MEGQKEQTRQKEHVRLEFESNSRNEEFARVVAAVFMSRLDPTLEETQDVKTAVSEAVTNAIIHGYGKEGGEIFLDMTADPAEKTLTVCVTDTGAGIQDVKKAMEPLYTTDTTGERSGMGFSFSQIISLRRYHPSARRAKAKSHGIPIKSFCLQPAFMPVPQ